MVTVKYPNTNNSSGGVVTGPTYAYSFDGIARPGGMTENVTQPMVQSVVYNAASQITSMQYLQYVGKIGDSNRFANVLTMIAAAMNVG